MAEPVMPKPVPAMPTQNYRTAVLIQVIFLTMRILILVIGDQLGGYENVRAATALAIATFLVGVTWSFVYCGRAWRSGEMDRGWEWAMAILLVYDCLIAVWVLVEVFVQGTL